ncbi:MAG TPA: hypothetical protein VF590_17310, partial [Isosphaeraceae bacterium]
TVRAPEGQPFIGRVVVPLTSGTGVKQITITSQFAEVIYFQRDGNLYRRVLLIVPDRQDTPPGRQANPAIETLAGLSWQGSNDVSARPAPLGGGLGPVFNALGDLTNRENRAFRPRFSNDYLTFNAATSTWTTGPDGVPDDRNGNGIPDYYPTLYANMNSALLNDLPAFTRTPAPTLNSLPFPFLFPNAYSAPDPNTQNFGWIHSLDTSLNPAAVNTVNGLANTYNHAPLDVGDNLPVPGTPTLWWGCPTSRETAAASATLAWTDPVWQVNYNAGAQSPGLSWLTFTRPPAFATVSASVAEDDLLMTGVRSFDVKAYDPNAGNYNRRNAMGQLIAPVLSAGYYDLGYGSFYRPDLTLYNNTPAGLLDDFGHEGRIPPLTADNRLDAQYPQIYNPSTNTYINNNIGDNTTTVLRMRRVWCSWSTAYTNVPAVPLNPLLGPPGKRPPVYPSYEAPYRAPLRGIQIQVRVVDPATNRIRVLTVRQNFTD